MSMKTRRALAPIVSLSLAAAATAGGHAHHGADHAHHGPVHDSATPGHTPGHHHDHSSHAPISVMGSHTHPAGETMFSVRRMLMEMDGNRTGTAGTSIPQVLANFPVAPERMTMRMDMFGWMHAPSDRTTFMVMVPRLKIGMDHVNRMGRRFRTNAEGLGDLSVDKLTKLDAPEGVAAHWSLGVRLPTGEISPRDATPLGAASLLPYPMRLGGGTPAARLGYTRTRHDDAGSRGYQVRGVLPFGSRDGYRLGAEFGFDAWRQHTLGDRFSAGLRVGFRKWRDISGADPRLNAAIVPTARGDLRAGRRLEVGFSLDWKLRAGNRLALEYARPVRQDLDGPQLETDRIITLGWQRSF